MDRSSSKANLGFVREMNLPMGEYAIFGSGPLLIRGIIDDSNDLDIICRGAAWDRVRKVGELRYLKQYDVTIATMADGRITFGSEWGIGNFDVNVLIDTAEEIQGLPFVRLEHVIEYKRIANRRKDIRHLDAIDKYRTTE